MVLFWKAKWLRIVPGLVVNVRVELDVGCQAEGAWAFEQIQDLNESHKGLVRGIQT